MHLLYVGAVIRTRDGGYYQIASLLFHNSEAYQGPMGPIRFAADVEGGKPPIFLVAQDRPSGRVTEIDPRDPRIEISGGCPWDNGVYHVGSVRENPVLIRMGNYR